MTTRKARVNRMAAPACSVSPSMARKMEKYLTEWAIGQFPTLCGADRKPNFKGYYVDIRIIPLPKQ